jgi:hypothetical protein
VFSNRAATGAGRTRIRQENNAARNAENCLYKRDLRQGSTYQESSNLTYKEEVAGSIGHRPLGESAVLQALVAAVGTEQSRTDRK